VIKVSIVSNDQELVALCKQTLEGKAEVVATDPSQPEHNLRQHFEGMQLVYVDREIPSEAEEIILSAAQHVMVYCPALVFGSIGSKDDQSGGAFCTGVYCVSASKQERAPQRILSVVEELDRALSAVDPPTWEGLRQAVRKIKDEEPGKTSIGAIDLVLAGGT